MSTDKKYTPAFENESWKEMSQLLDKEMPVRKKRRFPLFLLLGSILLLIVTFLVYPLLTKKITTTSTSPIASNQKNIVLKNNEQTSQIAINGNEIITSSDESNPHITYEENGTQNINAEKPEVYDTPTIEYNFDAKSSSLANPKKTAKSARKNNIPSVAYSSSNIYSRLSSSSSKYVSTDVKVSPKQTITSNQRTNKVLDKSEFNTVESRSLNTLASLQKNIDQLIISNRSLPILIPFIYQPVNVKPGLDRWQFGIGIAYTSNFEKNIHGAGLMTRVDYNVFNTWALEGGVGIFRHSISGEERSMDDAEKIISDDDLSNTNIGVGDFNQDRDAISTYLSNVKSQIQLVSQLGIKRTFGRTFFISTGLKYRYNLARSLDTSTIGLELDGESFPENDVQSSIYLRNHFWAPYIGLGYSPIKNLSFRMEADFSNQSYLTASTDALVNKRTSFLQAEIAYKF